MIYSWPCMSLQATQVSCARFGLSCRRKSPDSLELGNTLHKPICTWVVFLFATTCPLLLIRPLQVLSDRDSNEFARASAWYHFYKPHLNLGSLHVLDPTKAMCKKGLSYRIYDGRYLHPSLKPLLVFGIGPRKDMVQGALGRIAIWSELDGSLPASSTGLRE